MLLQSVTDRPDLVARVFRLKLKALLDRIYNHEIFGVVIGHIHVIEFQKRGLPHAHILLILDRESQLRSPDQYDTVVCAELPDKIANPELYATVSK